MLLQRALLVSLVVLTAGSLAPAPLRGGSLRSPPRSLRWWGAAPPMRWVPAQKQQLARLDALLARFKPLYQARKFDSAAEVLERAMPMERRLLGRVKPERFYWLADTREQQDRLEEAVAARRDALRAYRRLYDESNWRVTDVRLALETTQRLARMDVKDRRQLLQATEWNDQVFLLWKEGKPGEALPLARKALEVRRDLLGEKHRETALSWFNLGAQHADLGRFEEADRCYLAALKIRRETLGPRHPDCASSLDKRANLFKDQGDHRRALKLFEQSLPIWKDALGEGHPRYTSALGSLALEYHALGQYRESLRLSRRARDLTREALGAKHLQYALCLHNLALVYKDLGDHQQALKLVREALPILEEAHGTNHPIYLKTLNSLAILTKDMGELRQALILFRRAVQAHRANPPARGQGQLIALTNLANIYASLGEYKRALELLESSSAILEGPVRADHAVYLTSLGLLRGSMGEHKRALELLRRVVRIRKDTSGEKSPLYASSLNNLAKYLFERGDHHHALSLFQEALRIRQDTLGVRHPDYLASVSNLAVMYKALGDSRQALALATKVVELSRTVFGAKHPGHANAVNNLASLFFERGEFDRAEPLLLEALAIRKESLGEDHLAYAGSLLNLAGFYHTRGDLEKARPLAHRAWRLTRDALGEKHPEHALCLSNLGSLYFSLGDHWRAVSLYHQALRLKVETQGEDHPEVAALWFKLARVEAWTNRPARAESHARQGVAALSKHLDKTFSGLSERRRLELLSRFRHGLDRYLSFAQAASTSAVGQYEQVLDWKGMVVARVAEDRLARNDKRLAPLVDRLRQVRAALARLADQTPPPAAREQWLERARALDKEKDDLESRLASLSPIFSRLKRPQPSLVARALPAGTVLVDFLEYVHQAPTKGTKPAWSYERRLLAFVVRPGRQPVCVPLGPSEPIERAVLAWRKPFHAQPAGALDQAAGRDLRKLVWLPLQKAIGGAKTILLAPDGALSLLPFAALPGEKPGSYLIEEFAFARLTSGRHLLEMTESARSNPGKGLLLVGGLDYGKPGSFAGLRRDPSLGVLSELPATALEIESIGKLYRRRFSREATPTRLTGDDADRPALQRILTPGKDRPSWRYLHLATHTFFLVPPLERFSPAGGESFGEERRRLTWEHNPLLHAGLILSGANASAERGVCRAEELAELDLRGTEVVVLSGCDTALGRLAWGEGVLGLQRAFQMAGARSLVASLWKVRDEATSLLMEEFYRQLWAENRPPIEALRQAQLFVLRNPDKVIGREKLLRRRGIRAIEDEAGPLPKPLEKLSHPALWAAFVLSGDWR